MSEVADSDRRFFTVFLRSCRFVSKENDWSDWKVVLTGTEDWLMHSPPPPPQPLVGQSEPCV